ncbi:MAG: hypothetical protein FWC03_03560 [Treponema sp.]|nr:hypothetical protein [Treponema sp.]
MNKNKKKRNAFFLALVPHRDARVLAGKYSDALIKAGLTGVYKFPCVAPAAVLPRPLCDDELKKIAFSLREDMGMGKFSVTKTSDVKFSAGTEEMTLFGPSLDHGLSTSMLTNDAVKIKKILSPLVIGAYLLPASHPDYSKVLAENSGQRLSSVMPNCDRLEFRAAAVANMFWRPFEKGDKKGFKWKIGKLFWLPAKRSREKHLDSI